MTGREWSEAQLQERVTERCDLLGLTWYHQRDSRRTERGWVDLVILGPRGARFAELKSEDGRCSLAQLQCGYRIQAAGLQYRLWRPSDWHSRLIQRDLEEIA